MYLFFCFAASVFFRILVSASQFFFISWLIFPTFFVGFLSSFSDSALKRLIRNVFLSYFHRVYQLSCCCLLTYFFLNLQATFFFLNFSLGITFWPRGRDGREHWHEKYIWKTPRNWSWSAIIWRVFNQSCHLRSHHALLLALWLSTCMVRISKHRV